MTTFNYGDEVTVLTRDGEPAYRGEVTAFAGDGTVEVESYGTGERVWVPENYVTK